MPADRRKMISKNISTGISSSEITENDLELINKYTVSPLESDNVYSFTVTLCDNEVDRDCERFTQQALVKLAELFVGKTGIFDHSMRGCDQVSRIYDTWIEQDDTRETSVGEAYTCLKAKAYMPITKKNSDLITEIKAGIKKEASISCSMNSAACSVCGAQLKEKGCKHVKGKLYAGKVCHTVFSDPSDAYEWSFVAVPAQPGAGVTKSYDGNDDMITVKRDDFTELEIFAEAGRLYKAKLTADIIRNASTALPLMPAESLAKICAGLSAIQLSELEAAFSDKAAKSLDFSPQLAAKNTSRKQDYSDFKI